MNLVAESARWSSDDDQRLQVFKAFYRGAVPEQRRRLSEYIRAVAVLSPADDEDSVAFGGEIGCAGDRMLAVQVSCSHLPDGPSAEVSPHLLLAAMEAWEQGEEFAPPDLFG